MSDRNEDTVDLHLTLFPGDGVLEHDPRDLVLAENLRDDGVPDDLDLGVVECPFGHDGRRTELVATVHDRDLRRELREERRLLHGRVAAADHDQLLVPEEEPVAGGAGRHASTCELLLAGHPEPHC